MMSSPAGHAPRSAGRLVAVGTGFAALAVLLWAVGMTAWQPLTEPVGPWSERLPDAHTYWARDLRFLALMAVVSGLVLAGGGRRPWTCGPCCSAAGALAVDVAVDRADPPAPARPCRWSSSAGWPSPSPLPPPYAGTRRRSGPGRVGRTLRRRGGVGAGRRADPGTDRPGTRTGSGRPDDRPAPAGVGRGGCAGRRTRAGRARIAVAVGVAAVGGVGLPLVRLVGPADRLPPAAVLGAVLLVGVTVLTRPWPGGRPAWRRYALLVPVTLVVPLALLSGALLVSAVLGLGAPLTALAGNSPIAGADALPSLAGLLAGLGTALPAPGSLDDRQHDLVVAQEPRLPRRVEAGVPDRRRWGAARPR